MDNRKDGQQHQFSWNPRWVSEFDSPWNVYFKFVYANHIRSHQLTRLSTMFTQSSRSNYWDSIKWCEVDSVLGTHIDSTWNNFIDKFVHPFVGLLPREKLVRPNLHFCPRCIELGLHSSYHQSIFIERCPFHNAWLFPGCPECGRRIPFAPSDDGFTHRHECTCGYPMWGLKSELSFPYIWPQAVTLKIIDTDLQKWLALTPEALAYFQYRVWIHPQKLLTGGLSVLGKLSDLLAEPSGVECSNQRCRPNKLRASQTSMWVQREHLQNKKAENAEDILFGASHELTHELRQVFKSVLRHIRRHVLGKHRKCIKTLVRGKPDIPPCPMAMAYVLTRMLINGYANLRYIDNGKPSPKRTDWPFYTEIDHDVMFTLKERHMRSPLGHLTRPNELKTVFAHLILSRFSALLTQKLKHGKCQCDASIIEWGEAKGVDVAIAIGEKSTVYIRDI